MQKPRAPVGYERGHGGIVISAFRSGIAPALSTQIPRLSGFLVSQVQIISFR